MTRGAVGGGTNACVRDPETLGCGDGGTHARAKATAWQAQWRTLAPTRLANRIRRMRTRVHLFVNNTPCSRGRGDRWRESDIAAMTTAAFSDTVAVEPKLSVGRRGGSCGRAEPHGISRGPIEAVGRVCFRLPRWLRTLETRQTTLYSAGDTLRNRTSPLQTSWRQDTSRGHHKPRVKSKHVERRSTDVAYTRGIHQRVGCLARYAGGRSQSSPSAVQD